MPNPGGMIYALGPQGTSWVKIGSTAGTVEKRLKQLQTGQPFPLRILATVPVETDMQRIERQVHAFLAETQGQGEWFEIPMDLAALEALIVRAVAALKAKDARKKREQAARQAAERGEATLGQRLKAYRLLAGLSQNQLAQRANVHRPIISEVESGKQANLTLETARRLTQVLGITLEMLAGDGEPENTPAPPKKRPQPHTTAPVG